MFNDSITDQAGGVFKTDRVCDINTLEHQWNCVHSIFIVLKIAKFQRLAPHVWSDSVVYLFDNLFPSRYYNSLNLTQVGF